MTDTPLQPPQPPQTPAGVPEGFRCGMVAIVGRPNVGKSTLMNALVGQKVSITSRKAQTTRHRITGIQTTDDAQFVFVDTPGFQTRHATALNRSLNRAVTSTLTSVDAVLFVVEAGRYGPDDAKVLSLLPRETPVILIVNKVDRLDAYTRAEMVAVFLQDMAQVFPFKEIVPMSAKNRDDILRLLGIVRPYLPEGEPMYDPEALTDRSERFLAAEIVREKVFRWTGDELPYSSTVVVDKFETEGRLRRVFVTILVDRDAHKAMIIGAKGAKLKQISTEARMDMEKLFDGKVYLEVWVKVKSGWGRQRGRSARLRLRVAFATHTPDGGTIRSDSGRGRGMAGRGGHCRCRVAQGLSRRARRAPRRATAGVRAAQLPLPRDQPHHRRLHARSRPRRAGGQGRQAAAFGLARRAADVPAAIAVVERTR